jgi:signal transduction histidine kinase
MDGVVAQYEHEAAARYEKKNLLHLGLLAVLLGGLLFQGVLVLRPALARIQQGISDLEAAKQTVHRKARFVELLQAVAAAANEATSVGTAMQFALDRICQHTGWPIGHVYLSTWKAGAQLIPSGLWHLDDAAHFTNFCEVTARTSFEVGAGLPGRVLAAGKAAWVQDIERDTNFPRGDVALELGIRGAFGFPVLVQGQVVAVLEFFSRRVEEPDQELLTVMSHVGAQLGQVVERARAQQELTQKADELARSNAELEQFAYVASHDLQEPLRMVASYTQLLARRYKGKLDAAADEFIGFAVDGATRMQGLIHDLLSYSRLTVRGQALQPTDSVSACKSALEHLRVSIDASNARITIGDLPKVMAYGTQLTQLFQNLIGNAIKYCDKRAPEIAVSAAADGGQWVFSVRDNGIGIESQYSERIFQMFQRLHTREQYSGTGIGLAICRKIAERHGGRIWVESRPGLGSNFLFTMPAAQETRT